MSKYATPLVSVIVTTKNNHDTLEACLLSIKGQTYEAIELVVVDNFSTDDTKEIARRYTEHVYEQGPERCAQRNYAAKVARGKYIVIIDSDMELAMSVIADCVNKVESDESIKGIIIPEESFGKGFWAQCKKLERSFYIGIDWIEAARFFSRQTFVEIGGYDESLVSGEDWDLSQRVGQLGKLERVNSLIRHNEGHINLYKTLKKKSYYAQQFKCYTGKNVQQLEAQVSTNKPETRNPYVIVLKRFGLFLSQPFKLFRNPVLGIGVLFMKVAEFGFGAFGYLLSKDQKASS